MLLWKCCTQYTSKFGKFSSGHRTGKGVFITIPKKDNSKGCSYYCTFALISHASKLMLKILQAWLQQYMNWELPDVQAYLEKAEESEIKLPTSVGSQKKLENSKKSSTSMLKPFTVRITTNHEKIFKRWEYQDTLPASWETCMQVKKQQ